MGLYAFETTLERFRRPYDKIQGLYTAAMTPVDQGDVIGGIEAVLEAGRQARAIGVPPLISDQHGTFLEGVAEYDVAAHFLSTNRDKVEKARLILQEADVAAHLMQEHLDAGARLFRLSQE